MTYVEFYAACNQFINAVNARAAELPGDTAQRMRDAVFSVVDIAQERQRNGKLFEM